MNLSSFYHFSIFSNWKNKVAIKNLYKLLPYLSIILIFLSCFSSSNEKMIDILYLVEEVLVYDNFHSH